MTTSSGSAWADDALARLDEAFDAARDPEAAVAMRAYMRDQFEFVGIPNPVRTAIARDAFAGLGPPSADDLLAFAHAAWTRTERDHQYVAAKLLRRHVKLLPAGAIEDLEVLITTKSWWDTVDELSRNVVGPLVLGGSVLAQKSVVADAVATAAEASGLAQETRQVPDGVVGAAVLTLRSAGIVVDAEVFGRISTSLAALR